MASTFRKLQYKTIYAKTKVTKEDRINHPIAQNIPNQKETNKIPNPSFKSGFRIWKKAKYRNIFIARKTGLYPIHRHEMKTSIHIA